MRLFISFFDGGTKSRHLGCDDPGCRFRILQQPQLELSAGDPREKQEDALRRFPFSQCSSNSSTVRQAALSCKRGSYQFLPPRRVRDRSCLGATFRSRQKFGRKDLPALVGVDEPRRVSRSMPKRLALSTIPEHFTFLFICFVFPDFGHRARA